MMEQAMKAALLGALLSNASDETQKKRAKLLPTFDNEADAIAYAQRVAGIKAGDKVKVINHDDDGLMDAVFTGHVNDDGCPVFLTYAPKMKQLCSAVSCWHAVVVD